LAGWYEESACTEFTDRLCKELEKNVTVSFALNVPVATNVTESVNLTAYALVVASTLNVDPAFVTVSFTPPDQSLRRRRLLQSEVKLYFIIRIPSINATEVIANYTVSNTTNLTEAIANITETLVPNITLIAEIVAAQVQSTTFQETITQACVEAQLVVAVLDVQTVVATVVVQAPPCPPNSFCIGSDTFPCSDPCAPGTYKTKNCTAISDQICSPCPAGHFCLGGVHKELCRASCSAGDI